MTSSVRDLARAAGLRLPFPTGDLEHRARVWTMLRRAYENGTTISAQVIWVSDAGAFLVVDQAIAGFAPERELPPWLSQSPKAVHRMSTLRCAITDMPRDGHGDVFLSPRLAAQPVPAPVSGVVLWTCLGGLAIDIRGRTGFAGASELNPESLLAPPRPAQEWKGFAVAHCDEVLALSDFDADQRMERAAARAEILDALGNADWIDGHVVAVNDKRGLVAVSGGLVWGVVEWPHSDRGSSQLAPGALASFEVLGRACQYHTGAHLELAVARRLG